MLAGPETMLFLGNRHVMLQQVTARPARPARPALRAPPPRGDHLRVPIDHLSS